ncbi:SDR family oxidoreductase [Dinghuibacter silviterrae]|uniref:Nucleoside-diphosphate-sugar epimerase n=1 Tax=Dinghuibacter silviterrae TaxID=1539049 RepID=A0A4R8DVE6_9BACT|nr:SDR family oxidoreductase [Dinghuibacter silviterrae]TDX01445.1 nucleoside-diphosphate-sugar epimerase [Dinghuibacter silviterrae]
MRVFITGATGFIGSALVPDLIKSGHQVLGLARTEAAVDALAAVGAEAHRGALEDLESLRSGAAGADAVIHLGFIHDFSKFAENCEVDRRAILALGEGLGSGRGPLIVTSGTGMGVSGGPRTEMEAPHPSFAHVPRVSEATADVVAAQGVPVSVVRLPQVHDRDKHGLVSLAIDIARQKGVSAYIGEGLNRWPAAYRFDAARVYHLALEKGLAGARYHAVGEEGVPLKAIAEAIGRRLDLPVVSLSPEQAGEHFGFLAAFMGIDMPASSALTQEWLGWRPTGPGMISDIEP